MRGMTKRMGGGIGGIGESKAQVYMEKSTGLSLIHIYMSPEMTLK